MKKITLMLFAICAFAWQSNAQLSEDFETAVPPAGWTSFIGTNGEGTVQNWMATTTAVSGVQAATVTYENVATGAEDWLVTSQFTPMASASILTFQQRQSFGSDYGSLYSVRVSTTSQTDPASFTSIDSYSEADFSTVYGARNVDLTTYIGTPIYVAFVMENDDGDSWFIDDVEMIADAAAPDCAMDPTPAIGATDVVVDAGSITIAWEAATTGDPATSYEVFWGTTSGSLTSLGTLSATTVSITGSVYDTTYYWMIVPSNVGGSATSCAEWSFTTESAPPPPANDLASGALPLILDEGSACGANSITGISNTSTTDSGEGTPSCGDYTGTSNGDLWYTFTAPSSGALTLNTENITVLTSVAGAYYSGSPGALVEEGCTEFGSGWPWDLSGLTGGNVYYLRVWDYGLNQNGTFDLCGYFASCTVPTDLIGMPTSTTEATLNWMAGDTETAWEYVVQPDGTGEPTGAGTASATPSASVTSLTADTLYEFYVRADCGGGSFSAWAGPGSFITTLPPANDDCASAESITPSTTGAEVWSVGNTAGNTASGETPAPSCSSFGSMRDVWYTTQVPLSGEITIETRAVAGSPLADTGMSIYSGACGGFTEIECDDDDAAGNFSLVALTGQTPGDILYIRIFEYANVAARGPQDGQFEVATHAIDPTLGLEDVAFNGFKYFPNPVEGTLSLRAQDNIQAVSVYNMLGQEVMRSAPNTLSSEVDMSQLQTGAYFVKVRINDAVENFRVIKE